MPFLDFFRNLFGRGTTQEPSQNRLDDRQRNADGFRNPIWQNDEDEDDVSEFSNRYPRDRFQFRVFSDPFEMTRFFETQMDDMMRNFFNFENFGNGFGNGQSFFDRFFKVDDGLIPGLPMPDGEPKGPRDEVLKPESDLFYDGFTNILPVPDKKSKIRDEVLKPSYEMPDSNHKKVDSDIDGKIQSNELAKIWKSPSEDIESSKPNFSIRSFGSSVSTQIVKRPDGSIEQRRTVKDSDGNQEIRITRQIGDKMHTVVTKKSKDGSEVKTEDIVNMDENELKTFDEKWSNNRVIPNSEDSYFPWHKFFGPSPKL